MERQRLPKSCTSKDPTLTLNNPSSGRRPSFVRKERKQKFLKKKIFKFIECDKKTTSAIFLQQARGIIVCKREVVSKHLNLWPDIFTLFVVYC